MKERLKNIIIYPSWKYVKNQIKHHEKRIALLIGTCVYNNLGDHLISYSEKKFLEDNLPDCRLIEIPTPIYINNRDFLIKYIGKEDMIFVSGGGWMGNLWPKDEKIIQTILIDFKSNPIVILPQTVYYDVTIEYKSILESARKAYLKCEKLVICTRDMNSYNTVKTFFPSVKTILAPDMALYLKTYDKIKLKKKDKIGICMRKDREGKHNENVIKIIKCLNNSKKIKYIDTISKYNTIPIFARRFLINKKLKEFSRYEAIFTDRLHGMIYSELSKTVCYAFDNRSGKVKGVYEKWLAHDENIVLIDDIKNLTDIELKKYSPYFREKEKMIDIFSELEVLVKCL